MRLFGCNRTVLCRHWKSASDTTSGRASKKAADGSMVEVQAGDSHLPSSTKSPLRCGSGNAKHTRSSA
uniref:Uncharacterized protein n=1 Tax=Peronospora matthiolae TaxID=2874970 RepID=A0AAV1TN11_9STRA